MTAPNGKRFGELTGPELIELGGSLKQLGKRLVKEFAEGTTWEQSGLTL